MSDDLVSRLRDANAHSTQRIFGSDIFDEALSQLTASPDREKVVACARKCADDLVQIIEAATKVAKRTGNTFVIDRQKVATMIAGHLSTLAPDEAALKTKLTEAEWLIRELCGHEGAEGFSEYLNKRLEAYEFTTKP